MTQLLRETKEWGHTNKSKSPKSVHNFLEFTCMRTSKQTNVTDRIISSEVTNQKYHIQHLATSKSIMNYIKLTHSYYNLAK